MNYQKIYDDICKRGQVRILSREIYTEKHHIIPKCLGGSNEKSNLTVLTAREHFICHWILAEKLYPNNSKLWFAFWGMCNQNREYQLRYTPSSTTYESARLRVKTILSLSAKNRIFTEDTKMKISRTSTGRGHTMECKQKLSENISGHKHPRFGRESSPEEKEKNRKGNLGKIITDEQKLAISKANKGKKISEETRQKMVDAWEIRKQNTYSKKQPKSNIKIYRYEVDGIKFHNAVEMANYFNLSRDAARFRCYSQSIQWSNWKVIYEQYETKIDNIS